MYNFSFFLSTIGITLIFTGQIQATEYSAGGIAGSQGIGVSVSTVSEWRFLTEDQLQYRLMISGLKVDDTDDIELNDNDYKGDISTFTISGGADWYPFSSEYADQLFLSAGIMYFKDEITATSLTDQTFNVGDTRVTPDDNVRLHTDVNHSSLAPYLSIGWGDRIRGDSGFSFRTELGVLMPFSDPSVKITSTSSGTSLSDTDLEEEKREIEDEIDELVGYVSLGVTYQF